MSKSPIKTQGLHWQKLMVEQCLEIDFNKNQVAHVTQQPESLVRVVK